jgi:hypothetical protein
VTGQELRDLADELRRKSNEAEAAWDVAEAAARATEAALASLDKTGYCVWQGEAIWETPRVIPPPAEFVPFDNDVPAKLAKKAVEVGLRNFFQAPKENHEG